MSAESDLCDFETLSAFLEQPDNDMLESSQTASDKGNGFHFIN